MCLQIFCKYSAWWIWTRSEDWEIWNLDHDAKIIFEEIRFWEIQDESGRFYNAFDFQSVNVNEP